MNVFYCNKKICDQKFISVWKIRKKNNIVQKVYIMEWKKNSAEEAWKTENSRLWSQPVISVSTADIESINRISYWDL